MASNDVSWKRKMLVQHIPENWSQDMLENFVEVVTHMELEEDGVEHFCGVKHTALLTFKQLLTEQLVENAQAESMHRDKPLVFSLIPSAPTAVLARDVGQAVTDDNLFYYFESPRSGGVEGTVKDSAVYPDYNMAVITFSSPEVAAAVLTIKQHSPSRGMSIQIESCYEQFHKKVLDDLKNGQALPVVHSPTSAAGRGQDNNRPRASVAQKTKPAVLPKPHIPPQVPPKPPFLRFGAHGDDRNFQLPQRNQHTNMQGVGDENAPVRHRDGRDKGKRRRNKSRSGRGGQSGSREDVRQAEEPWRNGDKRGSRGRQPFAHNQHKGRSYRQRSDFTSQPREAEILSFGPAHTTFATQAAAPQPIVLDADCNPIPQEDDLLSESATDRSVPQSETFFEVMDLEKDQADVSLEDISLVTDSTQHSQSAEPGSQKLPAKDFSAEPRVANHKSVEQLNSEIAVLKQTLLKTPPGPQSSTQPSSERWAEARETPSQKVSREKEDSEAERLKREKMELEKELQKRDQLREQERQQFEQELQKERQEKEQLKNRKKETLAFPAYQLRLMKQFAKDCTLCEVTIHEKEGVVEFDGIGDDFDNAKCLFFCSLQDSVEDSLSVSPAVVSILQTDQGQWYLNQLGADYSNLAFDVQNSCIVCAAFYMNDVQNFLRDLERNMHQEKFKVNKSIIPQLQILKHQLENDFPLARITLPSDSDSEVTVEAISEDFDLVMRELKDHCSRNQPGGGKFQITGQLEMKAYNQWCTQDLDDVKTLILKNNGDCKPLDGPDQVGFTYQCHKDVLAQVQHKLDNIRKMTKVSRINLQSELKKYSEQALVINGLHSMGIEIYSRLLEGQLKKEGGWETFIDFRVPAKYSLPKFEYKQTKSHAARPRPAPRPRPVRLAPRAPHQSSQRHHHSGDSIHPYSVNVGNSVLIIKSGNIISENVDSLVCVVAEDMDLKQTAVGQAILKKYPQCAQVMPLVQQGLAGRVITKAIPRPVDFTSRQQDASTLHLTVLAKWSQQQLQATIRTLVQKCLQSAVQQGNKSIAFPPLGMGRKFQFPLDTVVNAMVTTAHQFLQSNPGTLQKVLFVIYEVSTARQFREEAKKIITPPLPAFLGSQRAVESGSDQEDEDYIDDDDSDGGNFFITTYAGDVFPAGDGGDFFETGGGGDFFGIGDGTDFFAARNDGDFFGASAGGDGFFNRRGSVGNDDDDDDNDDELDFFQLDDDEALSRPLAQPFAAPAHTHSSGNNFEAQLCLRNQQDFGAVKTSLLRELRSTFAHEDRLTDIRTFKKLGTRTMDEIKTAALKKCIVLAVHSMGGKEVLVVRGQKVGVVEMMTLIKDKQHIYQQKHENREHKHIAGGVPGAAMRTSLPTYWKVSQQKMFKDLTQFIREHRTYGKLYAMDGQEVTEIGSLIQKTWVQRLVGAGKDAANLKHRGIQVVKVERLENPNLWEEYCTHRERLFRRQQRQSFSPLEKVKGSSGPVKTTSIISQHRRSVLNREMFPQINEHYLFHGTKKEYIQAIHDQGLDTRIASEKAMLGRGVYASESATKADQYTDDKTNRTSGNKTMILMRVLLGEPFINKASNPTKYSRPPCKLCYQDRCKCQGGAFFDCVIDDAGRNFREFVIYDRCMCYPEYFITYQRV